MDLLVMLNLGNGHNKWGKLLPVVAGTSLPLGSLP
jgi:hypothetical protein